MGEVVKDIFREEDDDSPLVQLAEEVLPEGFLERLFKYARERDQLIIELKRQGKLIPSASDLPRVYVDQLMEKHGLLGALAPTVDDQ